MLKKADASGVEMSRNNDCFRATVAHIYSAFLSNIRAFLDSNVLEESASSGGTILPCLSLDTVDLPFGLSDCRPRQ